MLHSPYIWDGFPLYTPLVFFTFSVVVVTLLPLLLYCNRVLSSVDLFQCFAVKF